MPLSGLKMIIAVFKKDLLSEFRTRYVVTAILLFVLTTITMIVFSAGAEKFSNGLASGLIWIIMFFSAMTGLSKSFVSEEERNTILFLKLSTSSTAVYFGKLIFNVILNLTINTIAILLFFIFMDSVDILNFNIFIATHILGSIGIASASTIISAIIAKASARGAIFPVLSFPVLLPLIILGSESTRMALDGMDLSDAMNNLQMMFAYSGVLISASYILFDQVWEE